jgi:hypothetical protein
MFFFYFLVDSQYLQSNYRNGELERMELTELTRIFKELRRSLSVVFPERIRNVKREIAVFGGGVSLWKQRNENAMTKVVQFGNAASEK